MIAAITLAATTMKARTQAAICISRTPYMSESPPSSVTIRIAQQNVNSADSAIRRPTGKLANISACSWQ